jgi:hypothetical protein
MITETTLTRSILNFYNALPECKAIKIRNDEYQERGTPDVFSVYMGIMVVLEVKRPGIPAVPTRQQAHRMRQWEAAGAQVYCVNSLQNAAKILLDIRRSEPYIKYDERE